MASFKLKIAGGKSLDYVGRCLLDDSQIVYIRGNAYK
jgi:hypothetical protein